MKNCPTCQKTYPDDFGLCPRDGTALVEAGAWIEGAVVRGKYRILAKLGQGGMGAVYKAVHLRFGEVRALKVMSPHVAGDPVFVKRFEQEAVLTRKLQHPNAVRVDDIDESEDGRPFIVMEFIEGQSLKHVIESEGPLPVPRVCAIIKQVAAALGAAHELGMVHRDIKPDNIVLVAQGSPSSPAVLPALKPGKDLETPQGQRADPALPEIAKVLDFGIAKLKEVRATTAGLSLTGTGVVIGTPQYMSPEQAAGKRGDELDGRSDLYSLGVVMYEMLSGSLPFKSDTPMGMLHAHMQEQPRPILSVRPDLQIPDAIAAVVMKCLEKKPEHRSASAEALIAELERAEKQPAVPLAPTVVPTSTPPTLAAKAAPPQAIERDAVAPPREPEARPRAKEAPRQPAPRMPATRLPQHPAAARASSWKAWAAFATVLVIVALGAWYFSGIRGVSPNSVNKSGAVSAPAAGGSASGPAGGERTSGDSGNKGNSHVASPQPSQQPANQGSTTSASSKSNSPTGNGQPKGAAKLSELAPKPAPPPKPDSSTKATEHLKNGDALRDQKIWDGAIAEYREAIRLKPDYAEAHSELAVALGTKGDWDRAIPEHREAIHLKPEDPVAHYNLGVALGKKSDRDGAIAEYREAIRLKSDYADPHQALGFALLQKGAWDGAITEYREAIRLKPDFISYHFLLGVALGNKGDWDGAISEYREAIRLKPDYADSHNALGVALGEKGDSDGAIVEEREAIRLNPAIAEAHYNLGSELGKRGDWDGVIVEDREAIRLKPGLADAHCALGMALEHKGDRRAALEEYRKAYEVKPKDPIIRDNYERLVRELNK